ncbi:hypothetical protein JXA32_01540 [Candidatus Sumerlaeota bacterium]|nr:hypothetical protein [Candidatus Sumerlaeota bacterium]
MPHASNRTPLILYFLAATGILFFAVLIGNQADLDLWGRMAAGALIAQNGKFPYHDVFSYTAPDAVWIDHEWGSGFIFYHVLRAAGGAGLQLLKLLLLLAVLTIVFCNEIIQNTGESDKSEDQRHVRLLLFAVVLILLLPPLIAHSWLTIRCQLFSYLCYALTLLALEAFRLRKRGGRGAIWLLCALYLFWINVHGGFAYGFAAIFFYVVWMLFSGRRRDAVELLLVALACLAVTLINPYGIRFHRHIIWSWALPRENIAEWKTVFVHSGWIFGALYSACLLGWCSLSVYAWSKNRRQFPGAGMMILATGIEGLLHVKMLPLFAITAAMLGPGLADAMQSPPLARALRSKRFADCLRIYFPVLLLLLTIPLCAQQLLAPGPAFTTRAPNQDPQSNMVIYPVDAVQFLQMHDIQGNLWCPFDWGEFLLWTLYPRMRISIDGRYEELYPHEVFDDAYAFYYGEQNLQIALKYPTTHIIIPARMDPLIDKMRELEEWRLIYRDPTALIYARGNGSELMENRKLQPSVALDDLAGDLNRFRSHPD